MGDLLKRYWYSVPWLTRVFILIPIVLLLVPPVVGWELETSKNILWSFSLLVIVLGFLVQLLTQQKFTPPPRLLLGFLIGWSVIVVFSCWWSPPRGLSWWGNELGTDGGWFLLLLGVIILLAQQLFKTEATVRLWLGASVAGAVILMASQAMLWWQSDLAVLLHLPLGVGNLVGKWNDFGLVIGGGSLVLAGLATFTFRLKRFRWWWFGVTSLLSFLALVMATMVNFFIGWCLLALATLLLFSLILARRADWRVPTISLVPLLVIMVSAFIFTVSANRASWLTHGLLPLQERLRIASVEVRPSFGATVSILRGVISQETWLGVGPAKFERAWWHWRPALGINSTPFWSSDFQTGFSWLVSKFITLGLLGGLATLGLLTFFMWSLWRLLFNRATSPTVLLLGTTALYWLAILVLYSPGPVIIVFAWFSAGIALGLGTGLGGGIVVNKTISLSRLPSLTLANATALVGCLAVVVAGFTLTTRTWGLWHYARAEQLQTQENFLAAETALDKAITLLPATFGYRRSVENNLQQLEDLSRAGEAEHIRARFKVLVEKALRSAQAATGLDRGDYRNWLIQGKVYEVLHGLGVSGSYEEAFASYQTATWLNPNNPQLWFELARLAASNQDWASAEAQLTTALARKPDFAPALLLLVQVAEVQGKSASAFATVLKAAETQPENFGLWFQLGYWQYRRGEYEMAITSLTKAWQLRPNSAETHYFLVLSYEGVGEIEAAKRWLTPLLQQEPTNPTIIELYNRLYGNHG